MKFKKGDIIVDIVRPEYDFMVHNVKDGYVDIGGILAKDPWYSFTITNAEKWYELASVARSPLYKALNEKE